MIYFHDDGVETNIFINICIPVDTCGKRFHLQLPSFTIDTSKNKLFYHEVDINTIYKSIIPQRIY